MGFPRYPPKPLVDPKNASWENPNFFRNNPQRTGLDGHEPITARDEIESLSGPGEPFHASNEGVLVANPILESIGVQQKADESILGPFEEETQTVQHLQGQPSPVLPVSPPVDAPNLNLDGGIVPTVHFDLSWTGVAGATGYRLIRSDDGGVTYPTVYILPASPLAYTDNGPGLNTDHTYFWEILAFNDGGDGPLSGPVSGLIPGA